MTHGQILQASFDFDNAILNAVEVSVTQDGMHLGSGHIMSHSYHVVKMVNGYYFKDNCEFTVCSMVH